ncbi:MAG: 16S rRNA (guanine(966)-N(2))-methyltransferase RsmD [Lachnospiraceae bacterium]|nr:16S rRNA (guanine(966)-N(2))-methyltransferase RsmD [Lachnospiraceae bacterium]
MRVIAGEARSLPLKTPQGQDTRPTTDRIKETLFNMLQTKIPCGVFIDLCSGSGSIGIEAISRGARKAYFVENGREAAKCIADNLRFTKFENRSVLLKQDVVSAISTIHEKHADIIFMDPPYQAGLEAPVLAALFQAPYVDEDTLIIIESDLDKDFSFAADYGFTVTKEKCYKTNKHVFLAKDN